jgi:replication factor C subunit 1
MKGTSVVAPAKTTKEVPDLEEAIEESDDAEVLIEAPNEDDEDMDLSKDRYIKKPKAKKTAAPKKAAAAKKRSKAAKNSDDDNLEDEDAKPKKRASRAKPGNVKK